MAIKRPNPHKTNLPRTKTVSQAEFNRSYNVARKVLRYLELDPNIIDVFSKKQKSIFLHNFYEPPIVKPDKPNTVPRPYVKNIHQELHRFLKTTPFGDPDLNLSHMELLTYGINFLSMLSVMHKELKFGINTPQAIVADQICAKFNREQIYMDSYQGLFEVLFFQTRSYSKINFRCYGFTADEEQLRQDITGCNYFKLTIRLTAHENETKKFTYNNIERKAYKLIAHSSHKCNFSVVQM